MGIKNSYFLYGSTLIAIGHPLIFLFYSTLFANGSLGSEAIEIFGFKSFSYVSTNIYKINLTLFSIFAIVFYMIFILIELYIGSNLRYRFFNKNINIEKYFKSKIGMGHCAISLLSSFNLLAWTSGVEGNIFGFYMAIPMLILCVLSGGLHFINIIKLFSGYYDIISHNTDPNSTNNKSHLSPWNKEK